MQLVHQTKQMLARATRTYQRLHHELESHRDMIIIYLGSAIALFMISMFLLALVKVRTETFQLGYKLALLEKEKNELTEQIQSLTAEIAQKSSYAQLIQLNESMKIGLLPPDQWTKPEKTEKTK